MSLDPNPLNDPSRPDFEVWLRTRDKTSGLEIDAGQYRYVLPRIWWEAWAARGALIPSNSAGLKSKPARRALPEETIRLLELMCCVGVPQADGTTSMVLDAVAFARALEAEHGL